MMMSDIWLIVVIRLIIVIQFYLQIFLLSNSEFDWEMTDASDSTSSLPA